MLITKIFAKAWQEEDQLALNFKITHLQPYLHFRCKHKEPLQLTNIS